MGARRRHATGRSHRRRRPPRCTRRRTCTPGRPATWRRRAGTARRRRGACRRGAGGWSASAIATTGNPGRTRPGTMGRRASPGGSAKGGGGERAGRERGASARRGDIAARAGGARCRRERSTEPRATRARVAPWRVARKWGFWNTHPDILRGERRGYPQQGLEGPAQGHAYRAHDRADDPHEHHSSVARSRSRARPVWRTEVSTSMRQFPSRPSQYRRTLGDLALGHAGCQLEMSSFLPQQAKAIRRRFLGHSPCMYV